MSPFQFLAGTKEMAARFFLIMLNLSDEERYLCIVDNAETNWLCATNFADPAARQALWKTKYLGMKFRTKFQ